MVFLLNNTWVMDSFGGWVFSLKEGFPGYILCHIFVGMLSILLHVDFNCIFILDLLWVMWKRLYSLLLILLTSGIRAMVLLL